MILIGAAIVLIVIGIFLMLQQTGKQQSPNATPATQTTPKNNSPAEGTLEECLRAASNSDANTAVIKQAQDNCRAQFE